MHGKAEQPPHAEAALVGGPIGRIQESQRDRLTLVDQGREAGQCRRAAADFHALRQVAKIPAREVVARPLGIVDRGIARLLAKLAANFGQVAAGGQRFAVGIHDADVHPQVRRQIVFSQSVSRNRLPGYLAQRASDGREEIAVMRPRCVGRIVNPSGQIRRIHNPICVYAGGRIDNPSYELLEDCSRGIGHRHERPPQVLGQRTNERIDFLFQ